MPKILSIALEPEFKYFDGPIYFAFQSYDRSVYSYVIVDRETNTDLGYIKVEAEERVSDDWLVAQINNYLKKAG